MTLVPSSHHGFNNINHFVLITQNPNINKQTSFKAFQDIATANTLPTFGPKFGFSNTQHSHNVTDALQYFQAILDTAEQPKD